MTRKKPTGLILMDFPKEEKRKLINTPPMERIHIIEKKIDRINFITQMENDPVEITDDVNLLIEIYGEQLL